jgi:hypothetical protein
MRKFSSLCANSDALFCFQTSLHYLSGSQETFAAFGANASTPQASSAQRFESPDWRFVWEMNNEHFVELGTRLIQGYEIPFGIFGSDRRRHSYLIGKTGTGKSTLLRNILVQDIEAGRGVGLIDPHGDLADDILNLIPPKRTRDVVLFDPSNPNFPTGLNLLRNCEEPSLLASTIVGAFKNVWRDSWGPRLEYILYATVAALSACENSSLLGIQRMLSDEGYRQWVIKQIDDPAVRSFWINEFGSYDRRFLQEAIAPIQNKVGQLLMSPLTRNVLGQIGSSIDARFIMDNKRIFIANLNKGKLGEDKAALLGSMLVSQFQFAAMSRSDVPEHKRTDFMLLIDEFQNFATDSFVGILSEARKYRLSLTLSHQYIGQVRPEIRDAVFGNVGSIISFRVGQDDAAVLEREFGGAYSAACFTELANYEVCAKILQNGENPQPFIGKTLPPLGKRHGRGKRIVRRSRKRYGTKKEIVENRIKRWLQQSPH